MITIIKDIPLINDVFNYDVILVGTSINNALGNGFQRQIRINFPVVDEINKSTNYGDIRKLGTVKVFAKDYNTFRGCRNLADRDIHVKEYLYLLKKEEK